MVTLDNTTDMLGKLIDSDGKAIITDDMPDDLKNCLKYLNDNNVSLLSGSNPAAYEEDYEPDPFAPGFVDDDSTISDVDSDEDDDEEDTDDYDEDEEDNDNVSDLNDIF